MGESYAEADMRIILTISILLSTSAAVAGPGDGREDLRYRDLMSKLELSCPEGTRLVINGAPEGGFEEGCINADGLRHGYFIRWFADGETWASVGRYERGRPVGRWIHFDPKGQRLADDPVKLPRRAVPGA
jgi:hypothetical protein